MHVSFLVFLGEIETRLTVLTVSKQLPFLCECILCQNKHTGKIQRLFQTKRKLKSKKFKFKREKRADSRFRSCKPVKNANDRTTVLSLTFTHLSVTATWETFWMVLLSVIISTFWLFCLVFPFAKHSAYKLPKIWNPEHGIRSTNCIYISSIAMNLKVIYVKHSEMSIIT